MPRSSLSHIGTLSKVQTYDNESMEEHHNADMKVASHQAADVRIPRWNA